MSLLSMLENAIVQDLDGAAFGYVLGISIVAGRLTLTVDVDGEGPDDPEREDIPEVVKHPHIVAVGKV